MLLQNNPQTLIQYLQVVNFQLISNCLNTLFIYADLGVLKGEKQKQLSKEFVRRWLIENGFQGLEGQKIPEMTDEYIETVSERYIELYEKILGEKFVKADVTNIYERIEKNVLTYLQSR